MELSSLSNSPDVQNYKPEIHLSLSRVGVTGVEKVIRIGEPGAEQSYHAQLECFVDLGPKQKGAHMSRFDEVVNEAIGEFAVEGSALRAEVTITARYPENKPAPVSGIETQEIYTLHGAALAGEKGTRRIVGVTAQGMTACPCAQELVAATARDRLSAQGFEADEIEQIIAAVPIATHNQRGLGTLYLGSVEGAELNVEAADLLAIVESSMSSEIYELMKRSDEGAVVEKAHSRPRFVEDCVREVVQGVVDRYGDLDDGTFVSARQENLETIHQHAAHTERAGYGQEPRR